MYTIGMSNMRNVDHQILNAIDIIRAEHNACTARAIASKLRISPDVVRYRMVALERAGLVTWTKMPGSVVKLQAEVPPTAPAEHTPEPEADQAPLESPATSQPKKVAAKKTSYKKAAPKAPTKDT